MLYCLTVYKGDEKIKTFIWDLITPNTSGEANIISRNHSGLHNLVPRGRNAKGEFDPFSDKKQKTKINKIVQKTFAPFIPLSFFFSCCSPATSLNLPTLFINFSSNDDLPIKIFCVLLCIIYIFIIIIIIWCSVPTVTVLLCIRFYCFCLLFNFSSCVFCLTLNENFGFDTIFVKDVKVVKVQKRYRVHQCHRHRQRPAHPRRQHHQRQIHRHPVRHIYNLTKKKL